MITKKVPTSNEARMQKLNKEIIDNIKRKNVTTLRNLLESNKAFLFKNNRGGDNTETPWYNEKYLNIAIKTGSLEVIDTVAGHNYFDFHLPCLNGRHNNYTEGAITSFAERTGQNFETEKKIIGYILKNRLSDLSVGALITAIQKERDDLVRLIVETCPRVIFEKDTRYACDVMSYAVRSLKPATLDVLVEKGLNLFYERDPHFNKTYQRMTLLHSAAHPGDYPRNLSYLIKKGVNPNISDFNGSLPLHLIRHVDDRNRDEVLDLIRHTRNINHQNGLGETPLHLALRFDSGYANMLVQNGADLTIEDFKGLNPIASYLSINNVNIDKTKEFYRDKLLDPNYENSEGKNYLMLMMETGNPNNLPAFIEFAANIGMDFEHKDIYGRGVLDYIPTTPTGRISPGFGRVKKMLEYIIESGKETEQEDDSFSEIGF